MSTDPAAEMCVSWLKERARECFNVDALAQYSPDCLTGIIEAPKDWVADTKFNGMLQRTFGDNAKLFRSDTHGYRVEVLLRPLDAAVRIVAAARAPGPQMLEG